SFITAKWCSCSKKSNTPVTITSRKYIGGRHASIMLVWLKRMPKWRPLHVTRPPAPRTPVADPSTTLSPADRVDATWRSTFSESLKQRSIGASIHVVNRIVCMTATCSNSNGMPEKLPPAHARQLPGSGLHLQPDLQPPHISTVPAHHLHAER